MISIRQAQLDLLSQTKESEVLIYVRERLASDRPDVLFTLCGEPPSHSMLLDEIKASRQLGFTNADHIYEFLILVMDMIESNSTALILEILRSNSSPLRKIALLTSELNRVRAE